MDVCREIENKLFELDNRVRTLGEEIGRVEAEHGPDSEEYREKIEEWNDLNNRISGFCSVMEDVAGSIKDVRHEYGIGK